jgi:hypothetical protein
MESITRIITAYNTITITSEGFVNDLISTKCSFFSFLTSSIVLSSFRLASATAFSAFSASFYASSAFAEASFSSALTYFY